jgi:hypothetical protein
VKRLASYLLGSAEEHNRYLVGAYALGAVPSRYSVGSQATMEMMESPIFAPIWPEDPIQLGATPEEVANAAVLADALRRRQQAPVKLDSDGQPSSGISVGGVAILVVAILVGLATWPRVSRWMG